MKNSSAKICIPVCLQRAGDLAAAIKGAVEVADIVEMRLDCLADSELELATSSLAEILDSGTVAKILTLRSAEQGGHSTADLGARRQFWRSLQDLPTNCLIDLELDLVLDLVVRNSWDES